MTEWKRWTMAAPWAESKGGRGGVWASRSGSARRSLNRLIRKLGAHLGSPCIVVVLSLRLSVAGSECTRLLVQLACRFRLLQQTERCLYLSNGDLKRCNLSDHQTLVSCTITSIRENRLPDSSIGRRRPRQALNRRENKTRQQRICGTGEEEGGATAGPKTLG
jgi:hypothetical protein